jgi:quercetin dioxygenase-like cupin family protein
MSGMTWLAITLVSTSVFAQDDAGIDPTLVSPDMYRVLLENEHVRVVSYEIPPGAKDHWHTHPPKVSYTINGGRLRITTDDGESFEVDEIADTAAWMGKLGRHYAENTGDTSIRILLVEIKAAEEADE